MPVRKRSRRSLGTVWSKRPSKKYKPSNTTGFKKTAQSKRIAHSIIYAVKFCAFAEENILAVGLKGKISAYKVARNGAVELWHNFECREAEDSKDTDHYFSVDWSLDADENFMLAGAGDLGIVRVFRIRDDNEVDMRSLIGHCGSINHIRFSPTQPNLIASASQDHLVSLWDISTFELLANFTSVHDGEVACLDFSPSGKKLASVGLDQRLAVWGIPEDFNNNGSVEITEADYVTNHLHFNFIDAVVYLTEDNIVTKSCNDDLKVSEVLLTKSGSICKELEHYNLIGCDYWFLKMDVDRNNDLIAVGSMNGNVQLIRFDQPDIEIVRLETKFRSPIRCVSFSNDGRLLAGSNDNGQLLIWVNQDGNVESASEEDEEDDDYGSVTSSSGASTYESCETEILA